MAKRITKKELAARVERGVRFLNREYGRSWRRRINAEKLALKDGSACVIGQLEGEYLDGVDTLGIDNAAAVQLGFNVPEHSDAFCGNHCNKMYNALTALWRKQLARSK